MLSFLTICIALAATALSVTITDIQGSSFLSPLVGQTVTNVSALVTAKGTSGFYLLGEPSEDTSYSNGLFVFSTSTSVLSRVNPGDFISLSGKVSEFRSSTRPDDLSLTELTSPSNITILTSNNTIPVVTLGIERSPPTLQFSALDVGPDGFLSVPNNSSRLETVNPTLKPESYGIDFWESLEGQLVKLPSPIALNFQNSFGEFWVRGDWPVTGLNGRGGLTMSFGPSGIPDGNPEAVIIGQPLDGTSNPTVAVGVELSDIIGVVHYEFGFYYVIPLTAPTIISTPSSQVTRTTLHSTPGDVCTITIGDYNVENMAPTSAHIPTVARHIAEYLGGPDLMFVQEIQDNSGPTNDGVVSANLTLTALVTSIANISGIHYSFTEIPPVDGMDGGQPGGNIRNAYLYRPEKLRLAPSPNAAGQAHDTVEVVGRLGKPSLSFNPGRVDPANDAWVASRKPLAAQWVTPIGVTLFTVNVHFSSKGGSSSLQGNSRPPVNLPIDQRTRQIETVATFVKSILHKDHHANVIVAGDYNEFVQTRSVFAPLDKIMVEIDAAAKVPAVERYTYIFDQNSEQLDHIFLSTAVANRQLAVQHIHVNTWSPTFSARISDHDPSIAKIRVC